jgi:hypothetical protein
VPGCGASILDARPLLVLAHVRNGDTHTRLAAGIGIGIATASLRYRFGKTGDGGLTRGQIAGATSLVRHRIRCRALLPI